MTAGEADCAGVDDVIGRMSGDDGLYGDADSPLWTVLDRVAEGLSRLTTMDIIGSSISDNCALSTRNSRDS